MRPNRIAADPRLIAVLGHREATVAVPASVIYQAAGLLFMPPFATAEALTRHGFDTVLRMVPDNAAMASQSAGVAALFGYRRMAVPHARGDDDRELGLLFEDAARRVGIEIVFRGRSLIRTPPMTGPAASSPPAATPMVGRRTRRPPRVAMRSSGWRC